MNYSEAEIEDYICATYAKSPETLRQAGLSIYGKLYRQVDLKGYGRLDFITVTRERNYVYVNIYELKKGPINDAAFFQIIRYARGIQRFFEKRFPNVHLDMKLNLIGSDLDLSSSLCYVPSIFYGISFQVFSFGFEGIKFDEQSNYTLNQEGF